MRASRPGLPPGYGHHASEQGVLPWRWAEERLRASRNYWICTARPDRLRMARERLPRHGHAIRPGRAAIVTAMRITRANTARACAICERSLLMGERVTRFSPYGDGEFVDVCPLCTETAIEHGWVKEGSPTTPTVPAERRRRRGGFARWFDARRPGHAQPIVAEPILRRLSESELAVVEAADLFNASDYRRTVGGIAKSLGPPRASIVPLSGVKDEMVVTIAWEISWYQYRVSPESAQPVKLVERGQDASDLDRAYVAWNAQVDETGRLRPEIARV